MTREMTSSMRSRILAITIVVGFIVAGAVPLLVATQLGRTGSEPTATQVTAIEALASDPTTCPFVARALSNASLDTALSSEHYAGKLIEAVETFQIEASDAPPAALALSMAPFAAQCRDAGVQAD